MRKGILFYAISFLLLFSLKAYASEKSTYNFSWLDPDKEVYVLQNRKFRKNKKFSLSFGGGKTLSGPFVDSYHGQLRASYFFKEEWGVTVLYGKGSGSENDTAEGVRANGAIPFRRIVQDYQAILLNWSPFYSKMNTFNKVFYYDVIFGLGFGSISEENNRNAVNSNNLSLSFAESAESHSALSFEVLMKFYITKNWSADLGILGMLYEAKNGAQDGSSSSKDIAYSHWDLTLGLGYTF